MKLETERDATEWVWAAKALAVVSAWNALGLFARLRKGPATREELDADPRAIATTLPVLKYLGLIAGDGKKLVLTEAGRKLVDDGAMPSERNLEMFDDLARMKDVLAHGGPVKDAQGVPKATTGGTRAADPAGTKRFLDMLYASSGGAAQSSFDWLAPLLPKGGRVLDLGGGHGRYARVFADAGYPTTLFDLPHVIGYAKERHGTALEYREGDFHLTEDFGGPYDLIFMANVVHGESAEDNASLVARTAKSLCPGGYLALKDMFLDEHGKGPQNAVFFGLTMLFYTVSGTSPTIRETHEWFQKAGLEGPEITLLDTQQLMVGRKPA
jgi:2-polyprenyl-3-methyl-5-hydroxy-6-metoxy-1,4-benzoquinol methylase